MPDSTRKSHRRKTTDKPKKPYADFPLTPHASGKWQKKINGRIVYFGNWAKQVDGKLTRIEGDGWKDALELYRAQADDLHAGRTPRITSAEGLTVAELCNRFLTAKSRKLDAGELSARSFAEYREFAERLAAAFGKTRLVDDLASDDFEALRADAAKIWGPHRLSKFVQCVRTLFKYGFDAGLLDKPVRFGPEFKRPSADVFRRHRAAGGKRLFSAEEIRNLLDGNTVKEKQLAGASVQLRAMVLLGINCAFGNSDCATLPLSAVDLKQGWIQFPRPKTGIDRRAPLWPETIEALKAAIAARPKPKLEADGDCVFITKYGHRWMQGKTDAVSLEFGKLLRRLGINGRAGLGFYSLRHTFRTIADSTKDFPAVRLVMGHVDSSIDATYVEHLEDERLRAVVAHVHTWLFPVK